MSNFRKANFTRGIVTVGVSIAFTLVALNQRAIAQTSDSLVSSEAVSLELLSIQDSSDDTQKEVDKPEEDKWALTDEDRMSDEEMDAELFGKSDESPKLIGAGDESKNDAASDKEKGLPLESDNVNGAKTKQLPQAPQPTIETYLRGINTLSISTYTPQSTNLDGVDVPMRMTPPQTYSASQYPVPAALRFQTPDIHHRPLYFEDQNLERYGVHRYRLQPIESARKFASNAISLPREIRSAPPGSCVYRANLRYKQPSLLPANR